VYEFIRPIILQTFNKKRACNTQIATKIEEDGGIDTVIDKEAAMYLDLLHRHTFGKTGMEPFVCSFCTHDSQSYEAKHGLLSQWRGYSANGGVAIVLNTRSIEEMMRNEQEIFAHYAFHVANVVYDNDNERIRQEFCKVFECFPDVLDMLYNGDRMPNFQEMFDHFVFGSTLVKHHGFHEENEVRIVVAPRITKDSIFHNPEHDMKLSKVIRYAQKGDHDVRYIELFGDTPLPIKRIIIGPARIQNLNHQKITDIVKGSEIEVVKSETPFLG
jgi:hypothetical protein